MNKRMISLIITSTLFISSLSTSAAFAKNFNSKQNVALNHVWTVTFNKPVNTNEAFENVYIRDSNGNKISTKISFNDDHTKMTISPHDEYKPNSTYTLVVDDIVDDKGDKLSDNATMQFTTANKAQQSNFDITSITADKNQGSIKSDLDPNSSFSIQLNKNVDSSTLNNVIVTDKDGNKANVIVSSAGTELNIKPNNDFKDDTKTIIVPRNAFKCNTTYTINLNGLKSADGQDIETKTYSFTTRDYKLNPTLDGIPFCADYLANSSKYASDTYDLPTTLNSLWRSHEDSKGQIILDTDSGVVPEQITTDWNSLANIQAKNMFNLQVALRKQNAQLASKDSSFANWSPGFNQTIPTDTYNVHGYTCYDYSPIISKDLTTSFSTFIELTDNLDDRALNAVALYDNTILNAMKSMKPQLIIVDGTGTSESYSDNLSRLALYQTLYALVGEDYANDINDCFYYQPLGIKKLGKLQINHVKSNIYLIKY